MSVYSQNLVFNSSFEDTLTCNSGAVTSLEYRTSGWKSLLTNQGSAKHVTLLCPFTLSGNRYYPYWPNVGYQLPHTGKAVVIQRLADLQWHEWTNWVVYLQTKLSANLHAGKQYYIGTYISREEEILLASNRYGFLLSSDSLGTYKDSVWIKTTPSYQSMDIITDTSSWTLIADTITAVGNEQYLTLGRFTEYDIDDTVRIEPNYPASLYNTVFRPGVAYFVDDVFIIPIDSLSANTYGIKSGLQYDAVYCSMDYATVSVKESFPLVKYIWYNSAMQVIDSLNPSIHPRLTQSETFYLKRQNPAGQIRWDTAYVTIVTSGCLNTLKDVIQNNALVYPNPSTGELYFLLNNEQLLQINEINIYNSTGQNVKQLNKETTQNISELPAGVYTLQIKTNKGEVFNSKLVKW